MIASLRGRVLRKTADQVVIDCSGVGYQVFVPLSTIAGVPGEGDEASLFIHTHVREDAITLYGFATAAEKELFLLLTGVSGIGPKTALAVLSGISAHEVFHAVQAGDDTRLCRVPGIGKKTAARLILELKDKLQPLSAPVQSGQQTAQAQHADDVVSALMNLGYKRPVAEDALQQTVRKHPGLKLEGLIREALSILMKQ